MKRLFLFFCLLLCARSGWGAVASVRTASATCTAGSCTGVDTTLVYAIDGTGGDGLQVGVSISCPTGSTGGTTITSVVYAAQSLTQRTTLSPAATRRMEMWSLDPGTSPTTGSNNITITISSPLATLCTVAQGSLHSGAWVLSGTNASTQYASTPATNSGTGTAITVTAGSSAAADLVLSYACTGDSLSSTTGTQKWNNTNTANSCGSDGGATYAGGSTSISWTGAGSDTWMTIASPILASGGGGGGGATPSRILTLGVGD